MLIAVNLAFDRYPWSKASFYVRSDIFFRDSFVDAVLSWSRISYALLPCARLYLAFTTKYDLKHG